MLAFSPAVSAATVVWDGGGDGVDLGLNTNYVGDVLPSTVAGDTLQFNGTIAGPLNISYNTTQPSLGDLGAGGGIDLALTAAQTGAVTILPLAPLNPLRLDAVTLDAGSGAFTIGDANVNNVTLGTAGGQVHTWTNNSANAATLGAGLVFGLGGGGTHTLALTGTGTWNVDNALGGALVLTKNGTGTVNVNGVNAYNSGTNVLDGVLNLIGTQSSTGNTAVVVGSNATSSANAIPVLNLTALSTLSLTGGNGGSILVGNQGAFASKGVVNQTGGTISNLNGNLIMGGANTFATYGFYNKTGGDITQQNFNRFRIGQGNAAGAVAMFYNSGGNVLTGPGIGIALNDTAGGTAGVGGAAVLYVTDGTMTSPNGAVGSTTIGMGIGGRQGRSEVTISNTGAVVLNGQAVLGGSVAGTPAAGDAGRVAVLNLGSGSTGGSLQASQISQNATAGALPTGYLNFNGGTFKAQTANTTFINGITKATVFSAGGTIDNNGVDVTIPQALTAPVGSGVTSIGVSAAGTGYVGAPYVQITGGGATTPATAVANLNGSGGISGITITNPGSGYTSAPTITLVGGGGSGTTLGAPTVAAVSSGGMSYTGFGKTTLSGANTYTGLSTITGVGTLSVTGSLAGGVAVTGGKLDGTGTVGATTVANDGSSGIANGNGGTGALTLSSLAFGGFANLDVRASATPGVVVTGNLSTIPANGLVTVNATSTTGAWTNGLTNLVSFGSLTGGLAGFSMGSLNTPLNARQFNNGLVLNGNNIALSITGDNPKWTGLVSGEWSTNTIAGAKNWRLVSGGTATDYIEGDAVVFDDSATGTGTIDIPTSASPTSTLFNNTTKNYTIGSTGSGGIGGSGGITKNGSGSVTISANNSYTGPTAVNAGTLVLSGSNSTTGDTTVTGGTLTISGTNSGAGSTTISGGALNINNASALGSGALTINAGGAKTLNNSSGADITNSGINLININDDVTFTGTNSLDLGTGAVTVGGTGTDRTLTVTANTLTMGELKAPTQGLVKQGAGTLVLTSAGAGANGSNIGGTLNVAAGTVQMNFTGAAGGDLATGDVFVNGLAGSGQVTNGAGEVRWLFVNQAASTTSTFNGTLNDGGAFGMGLFKQGQGTLTLGGVNGMTDRVTISDGTLNFAGAGSLASATSYILGTATPVFQVSSAAQINSAIQPLTSLPPVIEIQSSGAGAGPNAGSAGRLELSGNTTLVNPITFAPRNDTLGSDGIRSTSGNNELSGLVTVVTGGTQTRFRSDVGSNLKLSGGITTSAGSARGVFVQGDGNGEVSGVIADNAGNVAGTINLTKEGAGTWTLSGANTYTGTTTVTAGKLLVNGTNAGAGAMIVGATGTFGGTGSIGGNLDMLADGSTFTTSFSGGTIDPLAVTGNIDLSSLTNALTVTGTGVGSSWDIITYGGTLTGTFDTVTAGYSVDTATPGVVKLLASGGPSNVPGDYDNNGTVGTSDYTLWKNNFGNSIAGLLQNVNPTKVGATIDASDYTFWRDRKNAAALVSSSAVPEPATWVLVGLGLAAVSLRQLGLGRRGLAA